MYWKKERIVNTLSYLPAAQYPNISRQQLKTLSVKDASRKSLDFNFKVQNFKQQRLAYKLDKTASKIGDCNHDIFDELSDSLNEKSLRAAQQVRHKFFFLLYRELVEGRRQ